MSILESRVERTSPEFQENTRYFQQLMEQLNERIQLVQQGGGEAAIARTSQAQQIVAA